MKKQFLAFFFALAMITTLLAVPATAVQVQSSNPDSDWVEREATTESGATISVAVPGELADSLSDAFIEELIAGNNLQTGDVVTIWDVGSKQDPTLHPQPRVPLFKITTQKTPTGVEKSYKDDFIISVAKGRTATLTRQYTGSLNLSISGETPFAKGDIGATITASYTIKDEFKGPEEGSSYNSREYRMKYYGKSYSWTQTKTDITSGYQSTRSGTAIIPTKYASYSIDKKVLTTPNYD